MPLAYTPEPWGSVASVTVVEQWECTIEAVVRGVAKTRNQRIYPEVSGKTYAGHLGLDMFSPAERWAVQPGSVFYQTFYRETDKTGAIRSCEELKLKETA